jgi:hypothetical protein
MAARGVLARADDARRLDRVAAHVALPFGKRGERLRHVRVSYRLPFGVLLLCQQGSVLAIGLIRRLFETWDARGPPEFGPGDERSIVDASEAPLGVFFCNVVVRHPKPIEVTALVAEDR